MVRMSEHGAEALDRMKDAVTHYQVWGKYINNRYSITIFNYHL